MAYLTVRVKDQEGHSTEPLEGERVSVGRASEAGLTIKHSSISREHCAFVLVDGAWHVEDLGSANGTLLNREKIAGRTALRERDIVKIGKARLTFHVGEKRASVSEQAAIALDDLDPSDAAPALRRGLGDPLEATRCLHCTAWLSTAHRLPGDRFDCPRCGKEVLVASSAAAISAD